MTVGVVTVVNSSVSVGSVCECSTEVRLLTPPPTRLLEPLPVRLLSLNTKVPDTDYLDCRNIHLLVLTAGVSIIFLVATSV